jgi:hypothetical protein
MIGHLKAGGLHLRGGSKLLEKMTRRSKKCFIQKISLTEE